MYCMSHYMYTHHHYGLVSLCDCVVCKHTGEVSNRPDTASDSGFTHSLKQLVG